MILEHKFLYHCIVVIVIIDGADGDNGYDDIYDGAIQVNVALQHNILQKLMMMTEIYAAPTCITQTALDDT